MLLSLLKQDGTQGLGLPKISIRVQPSLQPDSAELWYGGQKLKPNSRESISRKVFVIQAEAGKEVRAAQLEWTMIICNVGCMIDDMICLIKQSNAC